MEIPSNNLKKNQTPKPALRTMFAVPVFWAVRLESVILQKHFTEPRWNVQSYDFSHATSLVTLLWRECV